MESADECILRTNKGEKPRRPRSNLKDERQTLNDKLKWLPEVN